MNGKSKKEEIISGAIRVTKNFTPILATAFQQIDLISPGLGLLLSSVSSIVSYYGDYANDRTLDFLEQFVKNKEHLVDEVIQSDKFKAIFIKTVGDNITEGNEEKRQLLKNYVLNFACGAELEFNEHTKLLSTLNAITMDELAMLELWEDDGIVQKDNSYRKVGRLTVNDIKRIIWNTRKAGETEVGKYEKHILKLVENKNIGNQILLSLGYKDLLYVLGENNFGSGEEAKVSDITEFGKTFLSFIKK
jgi:hypothetical protein